MPRYFFHTADGGKHRDREGIDCPNRAAARREAIRYAGSVLHDEPDLFRDGRDFRVEVTDESQRPLFTVIMLAIDAIGTTTDEFG